MTGTKTMAAGDLRPGAGERAAGFLITAAGARQDWAALLLLAAVAVCPATSAAQAVRAGADQAIGPADPGTAYTEPIIAAHPDDPSRLAVVAIAGFTRAAGAPGWHCATWQSHDGGDSWRRLDIDLTECADPAAVFDDQGRLHVAVLGGGGGVTVLRSDDGSAWDRRRRLRGSDHPILLQTAGGLLLVSTVTRGTGAGLAAGLFVMRSTDGGESFQPLAESVDPGARTNAVGPAALESGGAVYGGFTFMELGRNRPRFLDQGTLWTRRQTPEGLGPAVVVGRSCQTRVGFPTLAGGPDGVYAVCVGAGARDLLVYASRDGGRSWSGPRGVLGGDEPLLGPGTAIQRATPVLRRAVGAAVNRDGVLGIVWQDREGHPRRSCQRLLFAASRDGGRTFTPPVRVSTEDSCPANPANGEAGRQWPAGTDYGTVAARADGSFVAAWADARHGAFRIMTAIIRVPVRS